MSILIRGMKMPENCGECIWIQRGYPDWCDLPMGKDLYNDKKRPDWCPLVEVPFPHGPLIDADKLLKKGINLSWSVQKWVSEVDIGLMRTIIEAEEGEEA